MSPSRKTATTQPIKQISQQIPPLETSQASRIKTPQTNTLTISHPIHPNLSLSLHHQVICKTSTLLVLQQISHPLATLLQDFKAFNTKGASCNILHQAFKSSSPCPARQKEKQHVTIEESSCSSEEEPKRRTHINWTEEENLCLLSCWLHHSTYPVKGNDRKSEYYWKAVVDEFNTNMPTNGYKRSVKQLTTHWGDVERDITKFYGLYSRGQKKAKARLKGKGKDVAPSPSGNQPSQNMILYLEAMSLKAITMIKSAKEKKYQTYLKLLEKDTSNYSEAQHKRHEGVLDQLAKELVEE
uniref:Myb-like domain-containing protein n=1 Tax=Oryza punctata TaxID=4537 RepID=A0A0E0M7P5_ORYPU